MTDFFIGQCAVLLGAALLIVPLMLWLTDFVLMAKIFSIGSYLGIRRKASLFSKRKEQVILFFIKKCYIISVSPFVLSRKAKMTQSQK